MVIVNGVVEFSNYFKIRLKQLRTGKGLSQKQLAEILSIPQSTYANWEQGRREPSVYDIYNLLIALEVDPNELFGWDENGSIS